MLSEMSSILCSHLAAAAYLATADESDSAMNKRLINVYECECEMRFYLAHSRVTSCALNTLMLPEE